VIKGHRKAKPEFMQLVDARGAPKKGAPRKPAKATAPPAHMTDVGKQTWFSWEPILRKMGVFKAPDYLVAMEVACELYADWLELRREIRTSGRYYSTTNKAGDVMRRPHPASGQLADTERRLQGFLAEFGLTPSSRARLLSQHKEATSDEDEDSGEAFFR
jgi:P27 family predicted phage terminase small subunit